ncbi:proton-activated chloride channel-like [Dysidea avara]|uniref:proton-activated chloride channel-like n=1 Tax=Dysidea avara TaxID=196820 RepID=UPI003332C61E
MGDSRAGRTVTIAASPVRNDYDYSDIEDQARVFQRQNSGRSFSTWLYQKLNGGTRGGSSELTSVDETDAISENSELELYQPSCKDWIKLLILPVAYMVFFGAAVVYVFYTIGALVHSYQYPVQSTSYRTVSSYPAIGIAIIPDFSQFVGCEYRYYDDYSPDPIVPTEKCNYFNATFNSTLLNNTRNSMVFMGPTDVTRRQSLGVHYIINTTQREYNAIEYFVFYKWSNVINKSLDDQRLILADFEYKSTLFTFPAGFKTWVKMSYIETAKYDGKSKSIEFEMDISLAKYRSSTYNNSTDLDTCTVYFEWASPRYVYIQEILSTNFWNSLGAMCGVLITLLKAGDYLKAWVAWVRQEWKKRRMTRLEYERFNETKHLLN